MHCGFNCFVYILPFSSPNRENVCFRYKIILLYQESKGRLTQTLQQSPKLFTSCWMTLEDYGCGNFQHYNEANCTNFKFLLLGMFLVGNEAPYLFIVKEVSDPFFWLFPTIEYWFIIFIKLQMGPYCLRPAINYENAFSSPVGTDFLWGEFHRAKLKCFAWVCQVWCFWPSDGERINIC